ncbi:MAG: peptidase caspase catalytic subunit p20, partial [Alphaproteobacteria bacterium]|nr:peptidase caspase catalytic subunit p20 [Alphaproteobacteria bacterium]
MRITVLASALLLALLAPAAAQLPQSAIEVCTGNNMPAEARVGHCTRAIASGKLNADDLVAAYLKRGIAHSEINELDRSIADFDQVIQLKPDDATAYYNRGNVYIRKRQYDRAIVDYDHAIQLKPDHTNAYNNRGNAYVARGQYDRAIADYNEVIRLKP